MDPRSNWQKQQVSKPLYEGLLWSRPENRAVAGKLLIIGGNAYEFAAPASAYAFSAKAGIGQARVLLPDALKRTVGNMAGSANFAPSTPSGSFRQEALGEWLAQADWADGVLLAGDFGRNSETAIVIEKFLDRFTGQVTLTKDAADYVINSPQSILHKNNCTLVISLAQLQRLAIRAHYPQAFTFGMDLLRLVARLRDFSGDYPVNIVVKQLDQILVAIKGNVSSTRLEAPLDIWRVKAAAYASVWWLQNPSKAFAAITTSLVDMQS